MESLIVSSGVQSLAVISDSILRSLEMISPTESEEICVLCCREIRIFATGKCDHCVCHECSTRMRVLCEQRECPICRRDMPMVLFTKFRQVFTTLGKTSPFFEKKYKIVFETEEIQNEYERLLENNCKSCKSSFRTFFQLKDHVRREHELYYCDLCVDNLKIFPFERKCYNRKNLALHRRVGDPDDTSHRGHPLCEFCDVRYVDMDELYRHLRREHFFCHFCDADGKNHYYKDHTFLKTHFRMEHYLCEEGDCANETFTGAFRTSIDLQAHKALHHTKNKSKAEVKQARTLELEFTIAPRATQNGYSSQYSDARYPRYGRHNQHRKRNIEDNPVRESSNSSEFQSQQMQGSNQQSFNMQSEQEFPHLSGEGLSNIESNISEGTKPPENQSNSLTVHSYGRRTASGKLGSMMRNEDFPALPSTTISINSFQPVAGSRYSTSASQESLDHSQKSFRVSVDASKMKQPMNKTVFIQEVEARVSPSSGISIQCSSKSSKNSNVKAKKSSICRPFQVEGSDDSDSRKKETPSWVPVKKVTTFEEDFPALDPKTRTTTTVSLESKVPQSVNFRTPIPPKEDSAKFGHQITIKCKSKKKKQKKSSEKEGKCQNENSEHRSKKEPFHQISAVFNSTASSVVSENQENEDPSVKSSLTSKSVSSNLSADKNAIDESKNAVNLEEDFPPLPAPVPKQKAPPGFSSSTASPAPPPGFPAKNGTMRPPSPLNISLSSVARQLTSGENGHWRTIPKSGELYKNNVLFHMYQQPENFQKRNTELTKLVHQLVGENTNLFSDFKYLAGQFRQNLISADEYHKKCLEVLGRDGFLQIINELIALLPDINKQKELLAVHRNFVDSESKSHGAVPKWNCLNSLTPVTQLLVCAICQQVLVKGDYESHRSSHDNECCTLKT